MKKILVTGGCGYIGSHTLIDLIDNGFDVVSIDNNMRSNMSQLQTVEQITKRKIKNYNIDICIKTEVEKVFEEEKNIEGIIHFAALKSVPESVENPLLYYHNNLQSLIHMMQVAEKFNVQSFVFSSSCSVYGNADELPVTELTELRNAESPYGYTKQIGERIIHDFVKKNSSINFLLLRYFNPVGAHESALIGEVPFDKPNNLVPIITQTAIGKMKQLTVFGNDYPTRDGSCVRDYIHVMDLANAHTKSLQFLIDKKNETNYDIINIGSGTGNTVLEAIKAFEEVSGIKLNYQIGGRREGDTIAVYADITKAKTLLGWVPKRDLKTMMLTSWNWEKQMQTKK
ncbi:MAG: UDP-glucose 4-epimerase GalE [Bacteroidota bacterium]|jgi:UDP-glucose 4-epimerase